MKPIDRYIDVVMRNAFAAPADRERLEADLRAHFAEAEERGESASQIVDGLGTPEEVAAALTAEREIQFASFWERVIAFVADCGALVALALPPLAIGVFLMTKVIPPDPPSAGWTLAVGALGVAIFGLFVFYFPLLEARFGKTLGKHLLKIRVIRESGAPISLGQAFVRRLSLYFEFLFIDALFVPFTQKNQRALDIVAQTIVAREPGERAGWKGYALCLLIPMVSLLGLAAVALLCGQTG